MNICPHCKFLGIKSWKKLNATKAFPVKCPKCKKLSFLPAWWHMGSILSMEVLLWGSILLALTMHSWLVLLIFPLGVGFIFVAGRKLLLVPTTKQEVAAERKLTLILLCLFSLIIFILKYIISG